MALVKVASATALRPGEVMEVDAAGTRIALCNVAGKLHALGGECPHRGGPLGHGALHGHMIVCPWHAWEFDCTTGQNDFNPGIRLERYAVEISGDDVLLEIPG